LVQLSAMESEHRLAWQSAMRSEKEWGALLETGSVSLKGKQSATHLEIRLATRLVLQFAWQSAMRLEKEWVPSLVLLLAIE
jgi:hypothetical protein